MVAVGASAGGLHALKIVLGQLPPRYPWPVIVVLHLSPDYRQTRLDELLARDCAIPVREAEARQPVRPGVVHVAPAGYHLLVEKDLRFSLSVDEKVAYARPSVDVLFETVADACGAAAVGVILTGANDDGAQGLAAIRRAGGLALVQDPAQAAAVQMPQAALQAAGADRVLCLRDIGVALAALAGDKV